MKVESQKSEGLNRLGQLIEKYSVGMMTTVDHDGALRSRPLATLKMDAEPALWFLTSISSPKISEIDDNRFVGLSYGNGETDFVSVSGVTQLVRERDKIAELWTPVAKIWFPFGVDDPELVALKVPIHQAEYWDGPANKLTQLYALTKALVTGDTAALGENEKLQL